MESKVNYTIVGFFMIILTTVIIITGLWLSAGLETKNYKRYQVYMNESVAGLSKNAPVKYNGVDVGFVEDIALNLANPQQVILTLKVDPNVPVTTNTEAILTEQGITGIAYIGLRGGNHAPKIEVKPGQKYPVIKSAPSFLVRLDTTLQALTSNFDKLSRNIQSLVSEDNTQSIQQSLKNIENITTAVAKNSENIDSSIKNLSIVMKNTVKASKQFPSVMQSIKTSAESVKQMANQVSDATINIKNTFKQGDIVMQSISNQLLPKAFTTFENLQTITDNLRGLSQELKQNPSIILRGKTAAKPGPGE